MDRSAVAWLTFYSSLAYLQASLDVFAGNKSLVVVCISLLISGLFPFFLVFIF